MEFKNGVINIQATGYNCTRTVVKFKVCNSKNKNSVSQKALKVCTPFIAPLHKCFSKSNL